MLYPSNKLDKTEQEMVKQDLNSKNVLNWDDEKYYGDQTLVTNSHLKVLMEGGPEALESYYKYGSEDKPAYAFGRAFHCLILEPEEFNNRYYIMDDREICEEIGGARPTTTKKYKAWLEEIQPETEGKEILAIDDFERLSHK